MLTTTLALAPARASRSLLALLALAALARAQDPAAAKSAESPEKPATPKWDVSAPPGPAKEVAIDTDEGTWMSLDVSPDGREIVFDLLGDLYTIPFEGGEARALATGIAWEFQPRFRPDGKKIAFTSDAGGGDNLWVMDRDGSHREQVTKETFRLLNSPSWSPDGTWLAGRKHFTQRRSAGAGEIWLYHVPGGAAGNEGLQLTTRANEEKDLGEPAFSPDGRYVYCSYDSTPGATFQYNKDPNGQIYAIRRLDRTNGETIDVVTGAGGACRPTPSPDGRSLAFVRRVRFETELFVLDLASGRARPVYAPLERDMQETWAIHGVYPSIAWTPDNRQIVFWARGKIHRVDVASGASAEIPFHVSAKRELREPVRAKVDVAPDTFEVKDLRWVSVSPAGDLALYQALGHLWVRPLPDGEPRRLTRDDALFEFMPSFSRDGKSIVYTTWDDEELGSVRIVPAAGGASRTITSTPGQYADPAFTPDGKRVVFVRRAGGYVTSPFYGYDNGVFVVPAGGGEPVLVTRSGESPHFGADSERVFLSTETEEKDKDRHALVSIELDGSDLRTHLASENATEFRVSPDGQWVAFVERFNAFIAPFVPTGREVSIGPKSSALPIARVSRDAGENLHWSGDSKTLHWSLGPQLYTRALSDAFAFLDGAPEKLPEPPTEGRDISFRAAQAKPDGVVALTGGRIVTMHGDEVIERGTVVIDKNRIVGVGKSSDVAIPASARVIDVSGTTLIPGIIDVHAHGAQGSNGITPEQNWVHFANLAFGVTTIHDPSADTNTIFAVSELARAGLVLAPRTFSTGTILYGAMGSFKAEIESLDDARSHLRRLQAVGAFSAKSYNQPRREQRQQVIAAARELGMAIVPEGGSDLAHNLTMVVDGHTGVEHSLPVEHIYRDVAQLWGPSGVGYTPTLIVGYGGIWGENYWYQKTNVWEDERLMSFAPRFVVDPRSRRRTMYPDPEFNTLRSATIPKAIVDAGGRVQLGAHGQLVGLGAHWELWMLGQGGLTPMQAWRAATLDGARYLGLDGDIGSLEVGKLADLLVLEKDPLADLSNSTSIRFTVLNGRVYDARTMTPADGGPGTKPHFFWQDMQSGMPSQTTDAGCAGCGISAGQ